MRVFIKKYLPYIITAIVGPLVVGIILFGLKYYANMHSSIESREISLLMEIIASKNKRLSTLNSAMTETRKLLAINEILCI